MKNVMTAGAALLMSTSIATAGGLDRSGQPVGIIFEDGNVAQLSFGYVTPDVTGSFMGVGSGNVATEYSQIGGGIKTQINENLSFAVIFDQPYGASVDYANTDPGYPLAGTNAEVESSGITALARYQLDENFSFHGGIRRVSVNGVYDVTAPVAYSSTYSSDSQIGYVLGTAYERDDIALRVALTYSSEISGFELDGTAGDLTTDIPQSVNLDFQTGIATDTLLFGSVRWVNWEGFTLEDSVAGTILEYSEDVYTYELGVGRRLSDALAVSFSVGYEAAQDELVSNLGPTDGYISYSLGGSYDFGDGLELSGGVQYVDIGDATTDTINAEFTDNSALGVGVQIAYSF